MFHVNSLIATAGTKKLYSLYPFSHSKTRLSSSDNIHSSEGVRLADSKIGKLDKNLETFHNLLRNFFVDSIFCSEHLKSCP